jgi:hypothetical protein
VDEIEVVSGTIPYEGGTVVYTGTQGQTTTLTIPTGGVSTTTTIQYMGYTFPTFPISPGLGFAGLAFNLEAFRGGVHLPGFVFGQPATITVEYSDQDVAGLDEATLRLYYWAGTGWDDAANTCGPPPSTYYRDLVNNILSVQICHLSEWGMMGIRPGQEPRFDIYLPLAVRAWP